MEMGKAPFIMSKQMKGATAVSLSLFLFGDCFSITNTHTALI